MMLNEQDQKMLTKEDRRRENRQLIMMLCGTTALIFLLHTLLACVTPALLD